MKKVNVWILLGKDLFWKERQKSQGQNDHKVYEQVLQLQRCKP